MKRYIFILLYSLLYSSENSFITPLEYASQLYENPRGISCKQCHGDVGEGKVIATYIDKNQPKNFTAPAINKLSFKEFYRKVNSKRNRGMPRYYLTKKEIKALYLYIHRFDKKEEKQKDKKSK